MKGKHWKKLSILVSLLIIVAFALTGCGGNDGAQGPAGANGANGAPGSNTGTLTGTVNGPSGTGLAGVKVSNNITADTATTDSTGKFSLSLPLGTYTLTFTLNGYTTATAAANVVSAGNSSSVSVVTLSQSASGQPSVVVTTDSNEVGFGKTMNLKATVTPGSNGGTVTKYVWSIIPPAAGSDQGLGSIVVGADPTTAVVTTPVMHDPVTFRGSYDGTVTTIGGHIYQTFPSDSMPTTDLLGNPAPAGTIVPADGNFVASSWDNVNNAYYDNRFGVLPVTADTRGTISPKLVVTDSLGGTVTATMPAAALYAAGVATGVKDVALFQPVYVISGHAGPYAWTLTAPAGSKAALSSATAQNPFFVPDVKGAYTVKEGANTMVIYAGTYVGVIANGSSAAAYTTKTFNLNNPDDADKSGMWYDTTVTAYWPAGATSATYKNWPVVVPDSACTTCHSNNVVVNGLTAPDKFTPWALTAHATFFARGIDGITGNSGSCLTCHTVGYDVSKIAANGGFDDVAAANNWIYPANRVSGNWGSLFTTASTQAVARLSNIQCENCHGPQDTGSASAHISGLAGGTSGAVGGTRVTYSSEDCAVCHASGTGHHNYSEWLASKNPGLPGPLVTITAAGSTVGTTTTFSVATVAGNAGSGHSKIAQLDITGQSGHAQSTSTSCSRCHTAEGFAAYAKQLMQYKSQSQVPSTSGQLQNAYVPLSVKADNVTVVWTKDNAHSQTCNACHDPHDDSNPNQLRLYDSIPMTIVGAGVTGMGKGAICMACHNSRNGVACDAAHAPGPNGVCLTGSVQSGPTFLHEDEDAVAKTYLDTPHDNTQAEVLLGRDAFFMAGTLPMLSKHANVKDSCVGCHMTLNPAMHLSHGAPAGSGHQFYINDGDRPDLCANCHGTGTGDKVTGQGVVANVQNQFAQLAAAMGPAMMAQLPAGTIYVGSTHVAVPVASVATVTFDNTASTPSLLTKGGGSTFYFYNAAGTLISSGGLTAITSDAAGLVPVFGPNSKFKKAVWNYQLIGKDYSYGIHNPTFATTVLDKTTTAIKDPTVH